VCSSLPPAPWWSPVCTPGAVVAVGVLGLASAGVVGLDLRIQIALLFGALPAALW